MKLLRFINIPVSLLLMFLLGVCLLTAPPPPSAIPEGLKCLELGCWREGLPFVVWIGLKNQVYKTKKNTKRLHNSSAIA